MDSNKRYRSEWKYLDDISKMSEIKTRMDAVLQRDDHADEEGGYEVHSMYFDDYFDSCARENIAGEGIRFKYRIRYYGTSSQLIFLEKKEKKNSFCHKRSCRLTADEYRKLLDEEVDELLYNEEKPLLAELARDIITKGFKPVVIIDYRREAFVEPISNVRITFDGYISASDEFESFLEGDYCRIPIIGDKQRVLEVKFDDVLPSYIRRAVQVQQMNQQSFSKYYMGRIALQDYYEM